jgi:hypothetical protein
LDFLYLVKNEEYLSAGMFPALNDPARVGKAASLSRLTGPLFSY